MLLETSPDLQLPAVQLHKELLAFPFLFRYWLQWFSLIWSASYKPKKFSHKDSDYQSWSPESLQSEPLTSGCSRDPALSPPLEDHGLHCTGQGQKASKETMSGTKACLLLDLVLNAKPGPCRVCRPQKSREMSCSRQGKQLH